MPSIGELTATVRADISGYVGPMQKVVQTTQQTASAVQSVTAPVQSMGAQMVTTATHSGSLATVLKKVEHTAVLTSAATVGLGGHLGQLIAKIAPLAGSGGLVLALAAGVAILGAAWEKSTEEARKQKETVDDLVQSYNDMYGATVRLRREQAQQAVEEAQRGRLKLLGVGAFGIPLIGRVSDTEELTRATQALRAAEVAYAEHNKNVLEPGQRAAAKAERERLEGLHALSDAGTGMGMFGEQFFRQGLEAAQKWLAVQRALKDEINATTNAVQDEAAKKANQSIKGDSTIKDAIKEGQDASVEAMRGAANTLAQAFMSAFEDSKQSLMERIASVLRAAIMEAIEKIIAQKLFEKFLTKGIGGKGVADSAGGIIDAINPFKSGMPLPTPAMAGSGTTIIVPLDGLPAPMSPIEMARDAMHQALWVETARQAQSNGVNLSPRFR